MIVCGIIAEYNPFHNAHARQLDEARRLGASHIVAVMSGAFVQRGEPAIFSKFDRAAAAVSCGADLVLELPCAFATSSSERFALGGVSLLSSLGVDMLCFGSECGDITKLMEAALAVERPDIVERTRSLQHTGMSYPAARQAALAESCGSEVAGVLSNPNDLLGVDYLKAIARLGSKLEPFAIKRVGAAHDEAHITQNGIASASAIRKLIAGGESFEALVPRKAFEIYESAIERGAVSLGLNSLETAILLAARCASREQLSALPDCSGGLADRLFNASLQATSLDELFALTKTKRYTMARVRRSVIGLLLGADSRLFAVGTPYARILAVGKGGKELLHEFKKTGFPLSESLLQLSRTSGQARLLADFEARASDIFSLTLRKKERAGSDYLQKLFITE